MKIEFYDEAAENITKEQIDTLNFESGGIGNSCITNVIYNNKMYRSMDECIKKEKIIMNEDSCYKFNKELFNLKLELHDVLCDLYGFESDKRRIEVIEKRIKKLEKELGPELKGKNR